MKPARRQPAVQKAAAKVAAEKARPELVVITGLSGSGKGTALKVFEDLGYYCVDHLPIDLIPKFAELALDSPNIRAAALVIDIREGGNLTRFPALLKKLRTQLEARLVFLEADDDVIIRRFSETRRPHPLGSGRSVLRSIASERESLAPIRALADHVLDTSKFNVHELRQSIEETFRGESTEGKLMIYVNSFGFRHGVPLDSDLVFDVRFLPNPNYIPEMKSLTGRHPKVAAFIRSFEQTNEFIQRIGDLLVYLLPHYIREGKSYLTISIGCTGGHHRSVMMADEVRKFLAGSGYHVKVTHRDITK